MLGSALPVAADVVNLPVIADTFITSGDPGNNAGGEDGMHAGTDGPNGGNATRRGLLKFDLSGIPAGSTVTSAVLRLTVFQLPGFGAANSTFDLRRVLATWGEGNKSGLAKNGAPATSGEATWTARLQGSANWTAPGAASDAAAAASASTAITGAGAYSWSGSGLLSDVQFWLDNPAQNQGWLLQSQAEGTSRSVRGFASRENAASTPGVLEVGYQPPAVNVTPTVSISSPTNTATFVAGMPLTIQATATDADGSVTNVEFFAGTTSLGSDSTGPDFSIATALYTGVHLLSARATDDLGAVTVSEIVTNTGVTVPITNPIAERVPKGDITIELRLVSSNSG